MKQPIIIIPARMESERLPGKPLMNIAGTPLLLRTYHRALETGVEHIYVATSDSSIVTYCSDHEIPCVVTDEVLTGTHRCSKALKKIESTTNTIFDAVVCWQCDEPLVRPEYVKRMIEMCHFRDRIITLVAPMNAKEIDDPNCVKLVGKESTVNEHYLFQCFWFSRAPMTGAYGHCGIYVFRPSILWDVSQLGPTKLSQAESLEQLPWIEFGYRIGAIIMGKMPQAVNTKSDIAEMEKLYATSSEGAGENDSGCGGGADTRC